MPPFVHHRALHAFVHSGNVKGERPTPGVTGAADALRVNLGARFQVVNRAHAVPNTILGQVLTQEKEQVAGHVVLPRHWAAEFVAVGLRIPELPPLALPDGIVGEHDKSVDNHIVVETWQSS